jgi:hyaluronan synthase
MENKRLKADRYYPWLLFTALAAAIGLTFWRVEVLTNTPVSLFNFEWTIHHFQAHQYLVLSMTVIAVLILAWRIIFAWRYRAHAPVSDAALPTVTVIIPAYNEGAQILQTVRTVMASRYPTKKMQVICVDDGSKDDTWQWMKQALNEFPTRVKLIQQPVNRGKRHALMAGFAQASGWAYVTIDSDSEVLPDTLRHLVSPLVRDHRVGAVAGNVRVLNLNEGFIPKMMEVAFTNAFDFIRSGQSVYGGVFCTPGALSGYRAALIKPHLHDWLNQSFMGSPAAIGEDRALTNLVLGLGFRVVYQRKAVVLTKMPIAYAGLRRMLLRWARSNVRENLVMLSFLFGRFRTHDSGSNWVRLFAAMQMLRMTIGQGLKIAVLVQLVMAPFFTLAAFCIGCIMGATIPAIVYQVRYRGSWFGWKWAIPYSFYWLFTLCWIPVWGLLTASSSGWLTRDLPQTQPATSPLLPRTSPSTMSKAA